MMKKYEYNEIVEMSKERRLEIYSGGSLEETTPDVVTSKNFFLSDVDDDVLDYNRKLIEKYWEENGREYPETDENIEGDEPSGMSVDIGEIPNIADVNYFVSKYSKEEMLSVIADAEAAALVEKYGLGVNSELKLALLEYGIYEEFLEKAKRGKNVD